jgi:hypothetical protein
MKDRWLREQTLDLADAVGRRMRTEDRIKENQSKRYLALEQRVHDLEILLWAEIEQRGTEGAGMAGPPPSAVEMLTVRLEDAIADESVVMFRYTKENEKDWELRQMSPYEVIKVQKGVVVRGWDHQRNDIRSFRLDRLEAFTRCNGSHYRRPVSS